jgi:hypothetical protein
MRRKALYRSSSRMKAFLADHEAEGMDPRFRILKDLPDVFSNDLVQFRFWNVAGLLFKELRERCKKSTESGNRFKPGRAHCLQRILDRKPH